MSTRPCQSYLLKSKEGAAARLLQHMPCSITAQHRPGAVRVWPRGLKVVGPCIEVSLSTIEKDCNPTSCHRVCLEIMDMYQINMIELPEVLTKEKLNISTDGVACQDDANRWSHLSGIQVPERINAEGGVADWSRCS